jgi:CheY-like chemotaxis protein
MPTILIVEDEQEYLDVLTKKLSEKHYAVLVARDGREAIEIVTRGEAIDLILLDLLMPNMDGFEFLHLMHHELKSEIPIIVLTNVEQDVPQADVVDQLIKANVTLDEVVARIEEAFRVMQSAQKTPQSL